MTWFKVDDGMHRSRKMLAIPRRHRLAAVGLFAMAGSWCASRRNGAVPQYVLRELGGTKRAADALVDAGLWRRTPTGYTFTSWRASQDGDYRPNIPRRVRDAVMERDGHACLWCGSTERLSLDHVVRYRDDGPDTVDNLRVLCMPCNNERG